MKTFTRIFAVLLAAAMLFSFAACNGNGDNETTAPTESTTSYIRENKTRISSLVGPLGIGVSKLGNDRSYAYEVKAYPDAQQVCELIKKGETDLAVLPVTKAASLYAETNGAVKILAVNSLGYFVILEKGKEIKSVADLKGKTIYTLDEGSVSHILLNSVLEENGLKNSVTVKFAADFEEIKSVDADVFMLPEPLAATLVTSTEGMRYAIDVSDLWSKTFETLFTFGVIVARTEYIEQNPEYIETFLMHNEVSVNYLVTNPNAAPDLLSGTGYFSNIEIAEAAFTGCNPMFMRGENMKASVAAVLEMLYDTDPALIGGAIPDDGIYFVQ